ncbi:MAG TPA: hypothetical protein VFA70_01185 [Dehalococcoidia bacterium]|jgi:hypothetical protein|nr:hypothetical protein [Dehalococcoidia bacterium]
MARITTNEKKDRERHQNETHAQDAQQRNEVERKASRHSPRAEAPVPQRADKRLGG